MQQTTRRSRKPRPITSLTEEQALVRKIEEVRTDRERLEGDTAIAALHRLEASLLQQLAKVRSLAEDD